MASCDVKATRSDDNVEDDKADAGSNKEAIKTRMTKNGNDPLPTKIPGPVRLDNSGSYRYSSTRKYTSLRKVIRGKGELNDNFSSTSTLVNTAEDSGVQLNCSALDDDDVNLSSENIFQSESPKPCQEQQGQQQGHQQQGQQQQKEQRQDQDEQHQQGHRLDQQQQQQEQDQQEQDQQEQEQEQEQEQYQRQHRAQQQEQDRQQHRVQQQQDQQQQQRQDQQQQQQQDQQQQKDQQEQELELLQLESLQLLYSVSVELTEHHTLRALQRAVAEMEADIALHDDEEINLELESQLGVHSGNEVQQDERDMQQSAQQIQWQQHEQLPLSHPQQQKSEKKSLMQQTLEGEELAVNPSSNTRERRHVRVEELLGAEHDIEQLQILLEVDSRLPNDGMNALAQLDDGHYFTNRNVGNGLANQESIIADDESDGMNFFQSVLRIFCRKSVRKLTYPLLFCGMAVGLMYYFRKS